MIRKLTRLASLCGFLFAYSALSGGTNQFVTTLNQKWAQHNATNLIAFVDSELQARPNDPQVLFARAVVAGEM
jgi:hypothetical protein